MAELKVPSLGMDMSEATIVRWLVSEGDEVEKGDPVLEIDTDKTSFEVEAPETGIVRNIARDEGETIPVGALLAHILSPGEEPPEPVDSPEPEAPDPEDISEEAVSEDMADSVKSAAGESSGKAKGLRASPAARRAAKERGIELSEVSGSGPNGRVYLSDVVSFEAPATGPEEAAASVNGSGDSEEVGEAGIRRETLSQIRRLGAERTQRSFAEVPHFYLRRDLDAEGLVELRERLKKKLDPAPSLNDLISFAVVRTLEDHPRLNARFDAGELLVGEYVNLGVAAATERGLVVPVVKGANELRLRDLAMKTRELFEKARSGKLSREELSGGTFTISNLGMMGVDSFDAIINQPEAAILAVGRLRTVPEWVDGEWFPRWVISVTLSVDHRVADGADGARFLADLQEGISNWELMM
ncbi:MAG: 2-oxo acid dehydrogenase subunit E2 [Rubrobacter sp.]|nr:2-oxo acid dehydrogenase subunit E2 [Rubrobacter sp.]